MESKIFDKFYSKQAITFCNHVKCYVPKLKDTLRIIINIEIMIAYTNTLYKIFKLFYR